MRPLILLALATLAAACGTQGVTLTATPCVARRLMPAQGAGNSVNGTGVISGPAPKATSGGPAYVYGFTFSLANDGPNALVTIRIEASGLAAETQAYDVFFNAPANTPNIREVENDVTMSPENPTNHFRSATPMQRFAFTIKTAQLESHAVVEGDAEATVVLPGSDPAASCAL